MKKILILSITIITSFCHSELTQKEKFEKTEFIIKEAEKKWPHNYVMQAHTIEQQVSAMIKLEEIKDNLKKG